MKKKKTVIFTLGILLLLVVTLGGSYSFFRYVKEGSTESSIKIGDITFIYMEDEELGNGIHIEDAFPMSDKNGKTLEKEGNYFDFRIDSNLSRSDLEYEVVAQPVDGSTLPFNAIKLYMTDITNGEEVAVANSLNDDGSVKTLDEYLETKIENVSGKTLYQETILKNTRGYEKKFRVRMWIKEGIDWSDDQYMGKSGSIRINVYANSNRSMASTDATTPDDIRIERIMANPEKYLFEKVTVESEMYQYTLTVPNEVHDIDINVIPTNPDATVEVSPREGSSYSLKVGENFYTAVVTSSNKEQTKEYILRVVRNKSSNLNLKNIQVEGYQLNPSYDNSITKYSVEVPYETTSVSLTVEKAEEVQEVVIEGNKELTVGNNEFVITVTAEDQTTRVYTVTIIRQRDTTNTLESLSVDGYALVPQFASDTLEYQVTTEETSIEINAVMTSSVSHISGLGKQQIKWGIQEFIIAVTSQSGSIKNYKITVNNQRPTAPEILGGGDSWTALAPTISVNPQKPGVALSGISGYEYILQSTSAVPADDASITDSVTTDSPSIIVHEEGINYIFFRTVSRNGNRSEWSGPQLIKLDTHPIKLTVQDIKGYAATSTYSTLRYSFYLDDIKLGDVITYEFNVSGVEDNDVLSDFNDRGLNSNILCSDNQCTIQGEIVTTSYDFSIRDKTDYSKYRFFDIVASQTLPVNNISYDVVVHRFTES